MELLPGIEIAGLGLYLVKDKVLVISDLHIGYEESLNDSGVMVPRSFFKEMYESTKSLLERFDCKTIVLNGDIKHDFGRILRTEWNHTLRYLDLFKGKKVVLVRGNHDVLASYIAKKADLSVVDYYLSGDILIAHGDVLLDIGAIEKRDGVKIKTLIIGHDHPAVALTSNSRKETYKCFLSGKTDAKKYGLVVMPSFNTVTTGTDVLCSSLLSPYMQHDLSKFKVIIAGDREYDFGTIKGLREKFTKD